MADGGAVGRPCIDVSKDDILVLKGLNYSWTKIADILGISRRTLYRRLEEFNIDPGVFTDMAESDLDELLKNIKSENPNCGEVMVQGILIHKGIKIPREKLRAAIHRVDHENTVQRQTSVISHRTYTSPHPNAVWHIDGNHKMIRWRLIIHAGIDGFSRCVTYVKCSNNNCADTVLEAFLEGISMFGVPVHVRSDHGGENMRVWEYMLSSFNDPSSIITGSSVHNERIERLWRDITRCVSTTYIAVFTALEAEGLLDPINEVDLFCLHYVFIPRINKSLSDFQGGWNSHSLSTEANRTPMQLYVEGLLVSGECSRSTTQQSSNSSSGVLSNEVEYVEVPTTRFIPCQLAATELENINPTSDCTDHGKHFYKQCVQLIGEHLLGNCNNCQYQ